MAQSFYSNNQVELEAVFEDSNNICVCSIVQIRDYSKRTWSDEEYNVKNDQDLGNYDDSAESSDYAKNHEDITNYDNDKPYIPFEGEYEDDLEIMKSMGLPTSFGGKTRYKERKGVYDKDYDYDEKNDFMSDEYDVLPEETDCDKDTKELDLEWNEYWEQNGEIIVLNSWIQKYKDYINPDYLEENILHPQSANNSNDNNKENACILNNVIGEFQNVNFVDSGPIRDVSKVAQSEQEVIKPKRNKKRKKNPNKNNIDITNNIDKTNDIDKSNEPIEEIRTEEHIANEDPSFTDCEKPPKEDYNNMFSVKVPFKDEESYEIPCTDVAWDKLWVQHSQEQKDYHYTLFKNLYLNEKHHVLEDEASTDSEETGIANEKCEYCKRQNCYFCTGDELNDYALLGDICLIDAVEEELPENLENPSTMDVCSDEDSPNEIPIQFKRDHPSDSEETSETSVKHIQDLGFVIEATATIRIKSRKKHKSKHRKWKCPLNMKTQLMTCEKTNKHDPTSVEQKDNALDTSVSMEVVPDPRTVGDPFAVPDHPAFRKYWSQRYRLFSLFDRGIMLDEESWFSVTPEKIASHIAERCCCDVIVDAFCGAGGNSIQFALRCYHVIAIDIDPKKIEMAKHNAQVYGVEKHIDFIVGDYFHIAPRLKADVVFLSPPWGGPSYLDNKEYNICKIEPDIYKTFEVSRNITKNIALFVPRNTVINELVQLAGEGNNVEIEQNAMNKKVKTITAYYGDLVHNYSME